MEVEQGEEGNRWKGRNRGVKGNRGTPPPPWTVYLTAMLVLGGKKGQDLVFYRHARVWRGGGGQDLVTYRIFLERTS